MREIKFRAKERGTSQWFYGSSEDFVSENANEIWLGEFWRNIETGILDAETCGQYTGLKDKNGKEIYEGDIIKFMLPDCTWSNPQVVIYCHSSFVTKSGNLWGLGYAPDIVHSEELKYLEVIGNIYENPELLEAKC